MKRKTIFFAFFLLLGLTGVVILRNPQVLTLNSQKKQRPLIGAVVFLTGPQAALGREVQRGMQLAKEDTMKTNGIDLEVEDSKDDPTTAISAINRLRSRNPDIYLITGDVVTLRARPVLEQIKIPTLATVAAGPGLTSGSKWLFRVFITAESQATTISNYAAKEKLGKVGILSINNEFGRTMSSRFKDVFEASGGKIVASETYEINDGSPKSQVAKVLSFLPNAVFVTGFGDGYAATMRQLREQGFKGKILSDAGLSVPYFRSIIGKAAEGAIFAAPVFDDAISDPNAVSFTKRYKERFGETPSYIAAYAYDAIQIASRVTTGTKNNPESVRNQLLDQRFDGLLNKTYKFSENGESKDSLVLKTIQGGQVKLLNR